MNYIDLTNKRFTHPITNSTTPIEIVRVHNERHYIRFFKGFDNSTPLRLLDVSDCVERKEFLEYYGFNPVAIQTEKFFPEFRSEEELISFCDLLNELLTKKYCSWRSAEVPFDYRFEDYRMTIVKKEDDSIKPDDDANIIKLEFE